jgi:hypothetical protein
MFDILNPFRWLKSAQGWFSKTEKSSGFRPYLIFLIIHIGLALALLKWFPENEVLTSFVVNSLYVSVCGFVVLYFIKSIQDPAFCRSERHIETVKKLELMEQEGDPGPVPIDVTTTQVISNPQPRQILGETNRGGE